MRITRDLNTESRSLWKARDSIFLQMNRTNRLAVVCPPGKCSVEQNVERKCAMPKSIRCMTDNFSCELIRAKIQFCTQRELSYKRQIAVSLL